MRGSNTQLDKELRKIKEQEIMLATKIEGWGNRSIPIKKLGETKDLGFISALQNMIELSADAPLIKVRVIEEFLNIAIFNHSSKQDEIIHFLQNNGVNHLQLAFLDQFPAKFINLPTWLKIKEEFNSREFTQLIANIIFDSEAQSQLKFSEFNIDSRGIVQYFNLNAESFYATYQREVLKHKALQIDFENKNSQLEGLSAAYLLQQKGFEELDEKRRKLELEALELKNVVSIKEQELRTFGKEKTAIELLIAKKKTTLEQVKIHDQSKSSKRLSLQEDFELMEQQLRTIEPEVSALSSRLQEQRTAANLLSQNHSSANAKLHVLRKELEHLKTQAGLKESEIANYKQTAASLSAKQAEQKTNIDQKEKRLLEVKDELQAITESLNTNNRSFEQAIIDLNLQKQSFETAQIDIPQKSSEIKDLQNLIAMQDFKLNNINEAKSEIEDSLFEQKSLKPAEVLHLIDLVNFDLKKELQILKSTQLALSLMDDVNLQAAKDYDLATARYDELNTQFEDLTKSINSLQAAIEEIEDNSKKLFIETFNIVNGHFSKLFPLLFKGGQARLVLTASDDPLTSGVEVMAQPPGKKTQNLNLLSGGEKALTAISLVLSLFLYRPSPFCILDEVDAPLDIANVKRFGELLKTLNTSTQFILITHNPKSMEYSDYIYGVTMEQPGASKIVSVDLKASSTAA